MEITPEYKDKFLEINDKNLIEKVPHTENINIPENNQFSIIIDGNGHTHVLKGTHTSQLFMVQSKLYFHDDKYLPYDDIIAEDPYKTIHEIYNGGISVTVTTYSGRTSIGIRCFQIPNSNQILALRNIYNSLKKCDIIIFELIQNDRLVVDKNFNNIDDLVAEIHSLQINLNEQQRRKLQTLREFRAETLKFLKIAHALDKRKLFKLADEINRQIFEKLRIYNCE
jgi:hypothetical protein